MGQGRRLGLAIALAAGCGKLGFEPLVDASDPATDVHDCGRVGHDCVGGTCVGGVCQVFDVATGELNPWGLALDATSVYWTNDAAPGSVRSCPLAGCTGTPAILASAATATTRIAIDATTAYFTEFDGGDVVHCPLGGGATTTIATGENEPMGIAVAGGDVFWAESGGTTIRVSRAGSAAADFATSGGPRTLIADSGVLYWVSASGDVGSCPLAGCANPTLLASGQTGAYMIAVYAGDVYWSTNVVTGAIAKCAIAGCAAPTTIASANDPLGVAVDATGIYWVAGDAAGEVLHCPLAGCAASGPDVLATGQGNPFSIATNATAIYWTNSSDGTVRGIAKP